MNSINDKITSVVIYGIGFLIGANYMHKQHLSLVEFKEAADIRVIKARGENKRNIDTFVIKARGENQRKIDTFRIQQQTEMKQQLLQQKHLLKNQNQSNSPNK